MTTYADIKADIADDLDDTTDEYGSAILKAVQGAQRDCERNTYYFNETRDVTFSTVAGQQEYTAVANANIPTLVHIQQAYITVSGQTDILTRITPDLMELLSDSSAATGEPYNYTYFQQKIKIYPIPGAVYTVRLQLGPYRLTTITGADSNNAWLDEAYDLIKARSKYRLYKNTLKDAALAAEALNDWREQDLLLSQETSSRKASGFICATTF